MIGLWRGLSALLGQPNPADDGTVAGKRDSEHWLTVIIVVAVIAGCVGIGLFPRIIAPVAVRLAEGYTFFFP